MQLLVRTFGIIENYVLVHGTSEVRLRAILGAIQFLPFHRSKERFHYGIVIRHMRPRKGVRDVQRVYIIVHCLGTVVATAVGMENQT